ncbi:uncharacterized protein G2W53_008009 [Senna tora]|uniref:Uncharacterized protein n=1 Tax=Senna tora TaxID=362788 RepID=A0A834X7I5_9FABA|nr:uncharacterized protein G2W53_008009 [Senna tora]
MSQAKDPASEEPHSNEEDQSIASHHSKNRGRWHPRNPVGMRKDEQMAGAQEDALRTQTSLTRDNPATGKPRCPIGKLPRQTLSPSRNDKKELLSPTPKRIPQPGHQNKTQARDAGLARVQLHPDPHQTRKTLQKQISLPKLKKQPKKYLRNYLHPYPDSDKSRQKEENSTCHRVKTSRNKPKENATKRNGATEGRTNKAVAGHAQGRGSAKQTCGMERTKKKLYIYIYIYKPVSVHKVFHRLSIGRTIELPLNGCSCIIPTSEQ